MLPRIFDISNSQVVINHNCLAIPELKAIYEKYEDPIPAFNYLHFRFDPESPYHNMVEEEKDEMLAKDFAGEYSLEDEEMLAAINKLEVLYMTPTYRYYLDNKILLEKLGKFARTQPITAGRDGNITALSGQIKSVGKTILEFKQLEKTVLDEINEMKGKTRGNKKLAYDQ